MVSRDILFSLLKAIVVTILVMRNFNMSKVLAPITRHFTGTTPAPTAFLHEKDQSLIREQALSMLRQKKQVLQMLTPEHYIARNPKIFNSTIGGHIRHSIDHFQTILTAVRSRNVGNYDERKRNTAVETDLQMALISIDELEMAIQGLDLVVPIDVSLIADAKEFRNYSMSTYVGRELSFASHHAIHHMSMIKLLMQDLQYSFPESSEVGIAPSTVQSQKGENRNKTDDGEL